MKVYNTDRARELRRQQTALESQMWRHLQNRQLAGYKFRRQVPRGDYIVDFLCAEKKLLIELDGRQHGDDHDQRRTRWLESQGYRVLRFANWDVKENREGALEMILAALEGIQE
jgi:very-short-patch-repair endonuclease